MKTTLNNVFKHVLAGWLAACVFGACAVVTPRAPDWVRDPMRLEQQFPRGRYFVGHGVCGGSSGTDVLARKEAENLALADIAANIEVRISAVTEHVKTDTGGRRWFEQDVVRTQTRRTVSGILSGAEITHTFYDARTLTWHAVAVLERARAGHAAQAQISRRLNELREIMLAAPEPPLQRYVALARVTAVQRELVWLLTALDLLVPADVKQSEKRRVEDVLFPLLTLQATAWRNAGIAVHLEPRHASFDLDLVKRDIQEVLLALELPYAQDQEQRRLDVAVYFDASRQSGTVQLWRVTASAEYILAENGKQLATGRVPPSEFTSSRSSTKERAQELSLQKLRPRLEEELGRTLEGLLMLTGSE